MAKFVRLRISDDGADSKGLLLRSLEQSTQPGGMDIGEFRRRLRVSDAIEKAPDDAPGVVLEDADWQKLSECVAALRWQQARRQVMKFVLQVEDDVVNAPAPSEPA